MRGRKSVLVSFKLSGESGIRGKSLTKNKQGSTLVSCRVLAHFTQQAGKADINSGIVRDSETGPFRKNQFSNREGKRETEGEGIGQIRLLFNKTTFLSHF